MKDQLKRVWREATYAKNVMFVILAFFLGITLNLSQYAIILLVVGVAATSTWWFSRPHFKNASSQLILTTLKRYPAVIIKNQPNLVAFGSRDPVLAAAYRSPVPRFMLKKHISEMKINHMDFSIADLQMNTFVILKINLNPYTPIDRALKLFSKFTEVLEMTFQAPFDPAERYEIIRLFGLENHLKGSESDFTEEKDDESDLISASSHQLTPSTPKSVKISFSRPKPPTTTTTTPKPVNSFNELILGLGVVDGRDQQATFSDKLSMKQCVTIYNGLKAKIVNIYNLDFENERLDPKILDKDAKYSFVVFGVNKFPTLAWIYLRQDLVSRFMDEFNRIKLLFSALNQGGSEVYQDRLIEIMNILVNNFQATFDRLNLSEVEQKSNIILKR